MNAFLRTALPALLAVGALTAPVMALDNPVVVDVHAVHAGPGAASATIFQRGDIVLVNVTATRGIPKDAAVTLNGGSCSNPGGVAFALSAFSDNQSMTQMTHSLSDIADKAKSLVVHQTADATSPALACGNLKS